MDRIKSLLRQDVTATVDRFRTFDSEVERAREFDLDLARGVGVTRFRELVSRELGITVTRAKDVCEQAVTDGILVKKGGGSSLKYADAEVAQRLAEEKADRDRRRTEVIACLVGFGIDVFESSSYGSRGIGITLEGAETLAQRLSA